MDRGGSGRGDSNLGAEEGRPRLEQPENHEWVAKCTEKEILV